MRAQRSQRKVAQNLIGIALTPTPGRSPHPARDPRYVLWLALRALPENGFLGDV